NRGSPEQFPTGPYFRISPDCRNPDQKVCSLPDFPCCCVLLTLNSVVFTFWTRMLDLIQRALELHGFNCCRIDGSTSLEERRDAIHRFNEDHNCTIMLAINGSSGEG